MNSIPVKLIVAAVGLAFVVASPADARKRKHHHAAHHAPLTYAPPSSTWPSSYSAQGYVDPRLGPYGPNGTVIFSNRVIGQDPDPNIRAAILKDVGKFFGGGEP